MELQWLEYFKSVFLKIPNVITWLVFQNQVTIVIQFTKIHSAAMNKLVCITYIHCTYNLMASDIAMVY